MILWQPTRYSSSERFTPTIVPVDICRTIGSDRAQPPCLHPRFFSAAASLLRGSVFALSDVGYALWDPGHHAVQRLGQTDLATQSRCVSQSVG